MRIYPPDATDKIRYTGPGGYKVEKTIADLAKGREVNSVGWFHVTVPKGEISKEHHHQGLTELFYFLTAGELKLNGDIVKVSPRTLIVLEPGDRHEVYATEADTEFIAVKLPNIEDDKVL